MSVVCVLDQRLLQSAPESTLTQWEKRQMWFLSHDFITAGSKPEPGQLSNFGVSLKKRKRRDILSLMCKAAPSGVINSLHSRTVRPLWVQNFLLHMCVCFGCFEWDHSLKLAAQPDGWPPPPLKSFNFFGSIVTFEQNYFLQRHNLQWKR